MSTRWRAPLLAALSGLMLGLPFLHSSLFPLTWVGFVPLLAAIQGQGLARTYGLGVLCGLVFYGVGAFWIVNFLEQLWAPGWAMTAALAVLFWFYSAQLPALLVTALQWLRRRCGWSDLLLFPALATLFFAWFPMLFQAQLGESQSAFLTAIQPVALVGVHGLDALIALVNALVFRWWLADRRPRPDRPGLAATGLCLLWLGYGALALAHWDQAGDGSTSTRIGWVQENTSPGHQGPLPGHGFGYSRALALSEPLADAGAALVVWPETGLDAYFRRPRVADALHRAARTMDTALLFQGMEVDGRRQFNSAALIDAAGEAHTPYRKIQRVAFGEYLPLLEAFPRTGSKVREQLGGFFSRVSAGTRPGRFATAGMELLPLICYEALFPALVADAARGGGAPELLVVLSNNAWFGASRQPHQHLNASALRAVENRRPLLHVINNGPSAVILPSGRRRWQSGYGEEAAYWMDIPLPDDTADTFFTRHPGLILGLMTALAAAALIRSVLARAALARFTPARRQPPH